MPPLAKVTDESRLCTVDPPDMTTEVRVTDVDRPACSLWEVI